MDEARRLAEELLGHLDSLDFIDAGYSSDRKYRIASDGAEYVLRLASSRDFGARQFEFESVRQLRSLGIRCPEAIQFGSIDDICYGLYSYIPGRCAAEELPLLSGREQHTIGREAGEQLRLIHDAFPSDELTDECQIRGDKFRSHRKALADLGITFPNQEKAFRFVEKNLHRLRGRPTSFRHGDFHPGNLIVDGGRLSGVIDFNRADHGDPWDDFYKTAYFGAPVSDRYARGLIEGYFQGSPADEFWPIYNVYVAAVLPADIVWTHNLFPHQLPDAMARVEAIATTYDLDSGGPPPWWRLRP